MAGGRHTSRLPTPNETARSIFGTTATGAGWKVGPWLASHRQAAVLPAQIKWPDGAQDDPAAIWRQ